MDALHISLVTRPSHRQFLIASTFYVLEAIENWTMGSPGNCHENFGPGNFGPLDQNFRWLKIWSAS